MSDAPRVSVIVPTFNRREMVTGAIESILAQTMGDFELIVVDDGSVDGTLEHLEATFSHDARVRLLDKDNGGSACARNFGVQHASAPWIAYLDSDDRWLPEFLESQLACASEHPDVDLVICDARYEGEWKAGRTTVFSRSSWRTPDSIDAMCDGAWALPSCMLMRAEIARRIPWDPQFRYCEDTAFLFQFNEQGLVCIENPKVLTIYQKHDGCEAAPQKVDERDGILGDQLAILEAYASRASDSAKVRYQIARRKARYYARHGQWREVRPYAWRWLRARPTSLRALRFALRSLFARPSAPSNGAR